MIVLEEPKKPTPQDFGIEETDLSKNSLKDILLSESLSSVIMVIGTVFAIWVFGWWGIGLACLGLGALYLSRSLLGKTWRTREEVAKESYKTAMELYYSKVHDYDAYMDEIERTGKSKDD
mgnify:CR=1 FL=1|tara:strand:+ start:1579 stop:1938 length:360 start_codon:yes stop_codon:yes gene_type:complete